MIGRKTLDKKSDYKSSAALRTTKQAKNILIFNTYLFAFSQVRKSELICLL